MYPQKENAARRNETALVNVQKHSNQDQPDMQVKALAYAKSGKLVFPLNGKIPLTINGHHSASSNFDIIKERWTNHPQANIGLPTGHVNDFWVLDIDGLDGEASLRKLEARYGSLASTIEVITGGGGRHLYFRMPYGVQIPNSASKIGQNLDVRGDGGYVVAPPSLHKSGRRYVWSVDSAPEMAYAPQWLINLVTAKPQSDNKTALSDIIKGVSEGQRNDSLARLAGKLLSTNLDPKDSLQLALGWNASFCKPPLPVQEVIKTFDSIAGRELGKLGGK